jgi:hypothetical protein
MVGHLHIGVQLATRCLERLTQPFAVGKIIILREKTGIAIMAPLNDVQGLIGKMDSGAARHWNRAVIISRF